MKQIIKNIISGGFEVAKDSAKKVGETVRPTALIEQATGTQKSEFTEYLKQVGDPNLTGAELEKKKKELSVTEEEEKKKLRTFLQATPAHMRLPQKEAPLRPYEAAKREEKRQEELILEKQKEQPSSLSEPAGKVRGRPGAKRRPKTADFEAGKNIKIG